MYREGGSTHCKWPHMQIMNHFHSSNTLQILEYFFEIYAFGST